MSAVELVDLIELIDLVELVELIELIDLVDLVDRTSLFMKRSPSRNNRERTAALPRRHCPGRCC